MKIHDYVIMPVLYGVLGFLLIDAGVEDWHLAVILFCVVCIDIYSFITSDKYLKRK